MNDYGESGVTKTLSSDIFEVATLLLSRPEAFDSLSSDISIDCSISRSHNTSGSPRLFAKAIGMGVPAASICRWLSSSGFPPQSNSLEWAAHAAATLMKCERPESEKAEILIASLQASHRDLVDRRWNGGTAAKSCSERFIRAAGLTSLELPDGNPPPSDSAASLLSRPMLAWLSDKIGREAAMTHILSCLYLDLPRSLPTISCIVDDEWMASIASIGSSGTLLLTDAAYSIMNNIRSAGRLDEPLADLLSRCWNHPAGPLSPQEKESFASSLLTYSTDQASGCIDRLLLAKPLFRATLESLVSDSSCPRASAPPKKKKSL